MTNFIWFEAKLSQEYHIFKERKAF